MEPQTGQTIIADWFNLHTPIGTVLPYAGTSAPSGHLLCDGSAVSRVTYAALFAIIGENFGAGDGITTFNLPNLQSSVIVGVGQKTRTTVFDGASAVDPSTDQITVTANDYLHTGQAVALTGSSLPTGLSATTYYVIRISSTVIKLATSVADANSGVAVNITADGSGACTLTQVLTSRALGAAGGTETQATAASHRHGGVLSSIDSNAFETSGGDNGTNGGETNATGSDTPNNMPPFVALNFIIRYVEYT